MVKQRSRMIQGRYGPIDAVELWRWNADIQQAMNEYYLFPFADITQSFSARRERDAAS